MFQAAKFGTEMQYQHLVFEEFARTIQPRVDLFFAPTQVYDVDLDASIVAEFAHTVYRFGHSMLTETVDRYDADFNVVGDPNSADPDQQLGLIAAFLNPLSYAASGVTPEDATSAIIRGVTRQAGNEIDEFVTEALRNNLLGLPLDLPAINIARGRDVGIPSLNAIRRDIYSQTGDTQLKPYSSWVDLVQHLKHPESLINFIAAYGTHDTITAATTLEGKRAAAMLLVFGGTGEPADRLDFLNGSGDWANVTLVGKDGLAGDCRRSEGGDCHGRGCHRSLDRRPGRSVNPVRRHARLDLQLRVREPDGKTAGRRPVLLPGPYLWPVDECRTGKQLVRQADHGQQLRPPTCRAWCSRTLGSIWKWTRASSSTKAWAMSIRLAG